MKFGTIIKHKNLGIGVVVATAGRRVCFIPKDCSIGAYGGNPESHWVYSDSFIIELCNKRIADAEIESLKEQIEDMSLDLGKRAFIEPI